MPTESPSTPVRGAGAAAVLPPPAALKCSLCGAASLGPTDGVVILGEAIERICATCVRDNRDDEGVTLSLLRLRLGNDVVDRIRGTRHAATPPSPVDPIVLDLARIRGAPASSVVRSRRRAHGATSPAHSATSSLSMSSAAPTECTDAPCLSTAQIVSPIPVGLAPSPSTPSAAIPIVVAGSGESACDLSREQNPPLEPQSKSLPAAKTSPWATVTRIVPSGLGKCPTPTPEKTRKEECASNPLLDVTTTRVPSVSRGCLYPGSIFTGSQRSGRNAYDVTITIVDVNMEQSTLCGYLTIKDLTETHPELTTFFEGEIIGPKYGFITGQRYGATEWDDMRHWERFEQFRRSATRADTVREEMLLRDPIPEPGCRPRERDHVFLRIKEKFLVPDHSVRDINGASFAGFYYAMIDFAPTLEAEAPVALSPRSPITALPTTRRMSATASRPDTPQSSRPESTRRASTSASVRPEATRRPSTSTTRPDAPRRQSTSRWVPETKAATLHGYYFHSLNPEPFQELSLVHQPPAISGSTFELR